MRTINISQVKGHVGESVTLRGWVYNLRNSAKVVFPILRDGSGLLQCVAVEKSLPAETFALLKGLTQESSLTLTGKIRAEQRAPGGFEMDVEDCEVLQRIPEKDPYPIAPKSHSTDFLMDHRHFWLRSMRQSAILRIRHTIIKMAQAALDDQGFTLVSAPILSNLTFAGESTAFKVDETGVFEGAEVFLSQTAQPYNEASAMAMGNVYSFGPVFSAEISKTRRHLAEFWSLEPEMAFARLEDAVDLAQTLVSTIVDAVLSLHSEDLKVLERDIDVMDQCCSGSLTSRLTYDEVIQSLRADGSETQWGMRLSGADESLLTRESHVPIIVERYPFSAIDRQFLKADEQKPEVALSFSVLAPEGYGEIIRGGERVHDGAQLGIAADWYADLRKYGTVPHAGFSLCIERMVAWICGLEHVRESIPFPRMFGRVKP